MITERTMKKIFMLALIVIFTLSVDAFTASAKDKTAGMRMEICEDEENDNVFSLFTYKDKDGTESYYLGLGKEFKISEVFDVEILGGSLSHIDEVCLWLADTPEGAMQALDGLLALFDQDVNTTLKLPARMATDAEQLSERTMVTCVVSKKTLGGKFLRFYFDSGKHYSECDLSKSTVKFLKKGLEFDMKKHKN